MDFEKDFTAYSTVKPFCFLFMRKILSALTAPGYIIHSHIIIFSQLYDVVYGNSYFPPFIIRVCRLTDTKKSGDNALV